MNYKDLWTSHSHRINADDSEKYMDEEDFNMAILEWESAKKVSRVELPVKPEIAEEELLNFKQKLYKAQANMLKEFKPKEHQVILDFIATISKEDLK
jgi:hypothetical protein